MSMCSAWTCNRRRLATTVLLLGAVAAVVVPWTRRWWPVARVSGPMAQEAYVWQRTWTPAVRQAVAEMGGDLDALVVLAAEIVPGRTWRVVEASLDHAALKATRRPIGLAVRIGPYAGPFHADDPAGRRVRDVAGAMVREARDAGVTPRELQLDFDCASSKLAGYRLWVDAVRRDVAPTPVTITALPTWLGRGDFADLAAATDGYVLQVHSLAAPTSSRADAMLCDPEAAREAVERAARLGVPFRVALPTYGYFVAFDAEGEFLGLAAETPRPHWPETSRVRQVLSDPHAMAALVRAWTRDRPAAMTGLIWYRLPVATDRLNWPARTFAAVRAGRPPLARLRVSAERVDARLVHVVLSNRGDAPAPCAQVSLRGRVHFGAVGACDGLGGFEIQSRRGGGFRVWHARADLTDALAPGENRTVAWVRLDRDDASVEVTLDRVGSPTRPAVP